MKSVAVIAAACTAMVASALERKSLDGLWDFKFAEGASIADAKSDFVATDRMAVPGCYDLMPKWYAKRGLGSYRRTFTLEKSTNAAFLKVKGMGLRARFFVDGREVGSSSYPYLTFELPLGPLAAGRHTVAVALDNVLEQNTHDVFQPYYDFYLSGGFYHIQALKTYLLSRSNASCTRLRGRARFMRMWCWPWKGRPSCQHTP